MDGGPRDLERQAAGVPYEDVDALIRRPAREPGERIYLERPEPRRRLSFADLDRLTGRLADLLADRGLQANDRVALLGDNGPEWLIAFFGVQRYGATVAPLNVEVHANNLGRMLRDVAPRLVFWQKTLPEEVRALVRASGAEALTFDEIFDALPRYPGRGERRVGDPEDIAIVDYTSGTTASPKGVCISHRAAFYMGRSLVERLGIRPRDRLLEYRSLAWASPQCLSLGPSLQAGARLVLAPRFSRRAFFGWIQTHAVTIAAGVPTVFAMLLEEPVTLRADALRSVRFVTSSAAPLAPETQRAFEARYGVRILQGCGMTEAGFMAINPPDAPRPGSIGPAVPYLTARFVDEAGAPCPPGREGELVVSGPSMASAYLEEGRLVPIPRDGFPTGDLGYADADGYLYLTGRKKDLIIRGGVNVAPMEITTVLLAHPAVAEAATIGVPDPLYGEAIASFVVPRPGADVTPADLLAHCRTRLSEFKLPRHVLVVDAIPKNERGKVARGALHALWQELAPA
ncbi:MAG: AMP-binding protein [Candidatus Rokubacteria bacterium]|nr:AMP-binding protein [Candidatus Rokubacteria bacterium]